MRKTFLALCLLCSWNTWAQSGYNYYTQYTVGSSSWQLNNQLSTSTNGDGSGGISSSNAAGGSVVSTMAVPGPSTTAYDAGFTVTASSSNAGSLGTYMILLGASNNAYLGSSTAQGSFYAVQFSPTMTNGSCVVNVSVSKYVNGVSQTFGGAAQGPCQLQTTYHAVFTQNNYIIVYGNGAVSTDFAEICEFSDSSPIYGHAGFGALNNPGGAGSTSDLEIYPISATAPSAPTAVQIYASPTRVDLRAFGSSDGDGPGIREYWWYRNNTLEAVTHDAGFTDATVQANTTYSYTLWAMDFDGNYASAGPYSVVIPCTCSPDPRETGVRPTSSYWGGMGEQIDMRSGNLNYTYPLVGAQSRGSSLPIALSYNSQNWRLDANGNIWNLSEDWNAGFGWTFQFGSVLPYYSDATNTTDHYEYQDPSGAIYRLDQNNNGVWSGKLSNYVWYDSNANILHFRDGSFWYMGAVAAAQERDAGTYYPTIIEDSNGNQITVTYAVGFASIWTNTSSRITSIADTRGPAYTFSYEPNPQAGIYYLAFIKNSINSGESFTLNYNQVNLVSPFSPGVPSFTTVTLASITNNNTNLTTSFTYDPNSGELTQVTLPYGGHIRWTYTNEALSQSTVRTVQNRYLYWDSTIGERTFTVTLTPDSNNKMTASASLNDSHAHATKIWTFDINTDATENLVTTYQEENAYGPVVMRQVNYTWAQDSAGNNYISRTQDITDPTQSYASTKQTDQTLDQYGNVTQSKLYSYTNLSTPAKTYTNTYLTGSNYTSRYIYNRLLSSTVTDGTNTLTLVSNTYDNYNSPYPLVDAPGITQHDANYSTSFVYRGNVTSSSAFTQVQNQQRDITGTVVHTDDTNTNHSTTVTNSASNNYAVPSAVTTANSLTTSFSWSSFLSPTNTTGPNGDSSSVTYDSNTARPSSTTSPYGAVTTYSYSNTAPQITATVNGRWTSTYLDGLGRTYRVATGYSSTTSYVDTVYDTCGCTPIGKVYRVSLPYAPGATPVWTVNVYDPIGRTVSTIAPDGASTTNYNNQGNTVTIGDALNNWKQYMWDTFGELTRVVEKTPNPGPEPNHVTYYTYDLLGHLTQVQMTRTISGTNVTQTRSWVYDPNTQFLTSVTQPESGTVTYTYNSDGTLATRTDAKSQRAVYTYDAYQELQQISRGTGSNGIFTEDLNQRWNYTYGSAGSQSSPNSAGRIATISYPGAVGTAMQFTETYGYVPAGGVASKALGIQGPSTSMSLTGSWAYDNEGRLNAVTYPGTSNTNSNPIAAYTYAYDSMGRLNTMKDQNNTSLVSGTTYNPANQILTVAGTLSETRTYNVNSQLIELVSGSFHYKYNYSATQNNGRITSMNDVISGESVTYQYDTLTRLINASGTGDPQGNWSQAFTYDGFGNLTQKTSSNAPALSVAINAANNRLQTNGAAYDANGNLTGYGTGGTSAAYAYDVENRLTSATLSGTAYNYSYDSLNQRVFSGTWTGSTYTNQLIYFYGIDGKKLGAWSLNASTFQNVSVNQWFAGRLLKNADRLQSVGKYFPYGEDRYSPNPANPANDQEKFATYTRDSSTGLDYAMNRYYNSTIGRFMTIDPYAKSADPKHPQTQNRYPYVVGDPVNNTDRTGLYCDVDFCDPELGIGGPPCSEGIDTFAPNGDPYPNPGCYAPIAYPPPTPRPDVQCDLQLYIQSAGSPNDPFAHTFIGLITQANGLRLPETYYEAGAVDKTTKKLTGSLSALYNGTAWLNALDRAQDGNNPFNHTYRNTVPSLEWETGFSTSNCAKNAAVYANDLRFPQDKFTYSFTSDSNSFTFSLLRMSGVSVPLGVNLYLGIWAPGWDYALKW